MANQRLARRQILAGAAAVGAAGALTALHGSLPARADDASDDVAGLDGSWLATVTVAGTGAPPPFKDLYSYSRGGVVIRSRQGEMLPPFPATAGQGTWIYSGDRTFAATIVQLYTDIKGHYTGMGVDRERITLDETDGAYSATFTTDFINPDGSVGFSVTGTAQATRVRVKPL